jgi:hypothetical protein
MKAIYCKCHKTHVEHWAKKIELHGIRKPSSPVCTKEQFRCLSKVDDVVVWFAKVYFFLRWLISLAPSVGPKKHYKSWGPAMIISTHCMTFHPTMWHWEMSNGQWQYLWFRTQNIAATTRISYPHAVVSQNTSQVQSYIWNKVSFKPLCLLHVWLLKI